MTLEAVREYMSEEYTGVASQILYHVVYCDNCSATDSKLSPDFWTAVDMIKAKGWLIVRTSLGWEHYCPDCRKARKRDIDIRYDLSDNPDFGEFGNG